MNSKQICLVVGASGGIGGALVSRLTASSNGSEVVCVSQRKNADDSVPTWIRTDYSASSIRTICERLKTDDLDLSRVFICCGTLHGEDYQPEKQIESVDPDSMHHLFQVNTVVPTLWLRELLPLLRHADRSVVAVLSARVGSIGDNRLGGWYSYRASKAALNMILKSAAIEYARRAKHVKLIAFHPGTTDTALSRPFQDSVPGDKLFSPDFVAQRLIGICDRAKPDGTLSYLDWDDKIIPW